MSSERLGLVLALISVAFGASQVIAGNDPSTAAIFVALAILLPWGVPHLWRVLRRKPSIEAHIGGQHTPAEFLVEHVLASLMQSHSLIIYGRSCRRWLVGTGSSEDSAALARHQMLVTEALRRGAHVTFIMQDLVHCVPAGMTSAEHDRLRADQAVAIESYLGIRKQLRGEPHPRLSLVFARRDITNSVALLQDGPELAWLVQDIGRAFKEKPFVAIRKRELVADLIQDLSGIAQHGTPIDEYRLELAAEGVDELVLRHPYSLKSRLNSNDRLVAHGARVFTASKSGNGLPAPLSVQLLVTNHCTTTCAMCTHFQMGGTPPTKELDIESIQRTLRWIHKLGTNSIILSGGEPLAHPHLIEILRTASGLGLHIGMLTSGVAEHQRAIDDDLAAAIVTHCSWIQVSIDSLDSVRYHAIRRQNLDICLESVRRLRDRGMRHVDLCYTIQHENVEELASGAVFQSLDEKLPGVNVRFKFAHGVGGSFLTKPERLQEAIQQISRYTKNKYLEEMLALNVFSYEGISQGLPVQSRMNEFKQSTHTCQAISATLFIDSNGDVYPCCYLFDDNVARSPYRSKYLIGSLRDKSGMVPDPERGGENPLHTFWNGPALQDLRKRVLPVEHDACGKCTRHVHQNAFLNELQKLLAMHESRGVDLAARLTRDGQVEQGTWV